MNENITELNKSGTEHNEILQHGDDLGTLHTKYMNGKRKQSGTEESGANHSGTLQQGDPLGTHTLGLGVYIARPWQQTQGNVGVRRQQ